MDPQPSNLSCWEIVSDAFSEAGAISAKGYHLRLRYNYSEPHMLECCCLEGVEQKFMTLKDLSKHILKKHCTRNRMCLLCASGKSGCNLSFRNVKLASKHVAFQHNLSLMMYYMCDGCQLLLPGAQALKYHLIYNHTEESAFDFKLIEHMRCFPCFLCLWPSKSQKERRFHLEKKHGLSLATEIEMAEEKKEVPTDKKIRQIQRCLKDTRKFLARNKIAQDLYRISSQRFVKVGKKSGIKESLKGTQKKRKKNGLHNQIKYSKVSIAYECPDEIMLCQESTNESIEELLNFNRFFISEKGSSSIQQSQEPMVFEEVSVPNNDKIPANPVLSESVEKASFRCLEEIQEPMAANSVEACVYNSLITPESRPDDNMEDHPEKVVSFQESGVEESVDFQESRTSQCVEENEGATAYCQEFRVSKSVYGYSDGCLISPKCIDVDNIDTYFDSTGDSKNARVSGCSKESRSCHDSGIFKNMEERIERGDEPIQDSSSKSEAWTNALKLFDTHLKVSIQPEKSGEIKRTEKLGESPILRDDDIGVICDPNPAIPTTPLNANIAVQNVSRISKGENLDKTLLQVTVPVFDLSLQNQFKEFDKQILESHSSKEDQEMMAQEAPKINETICNSSVMLRDLFKTIECRSNPNLPAEHSI